MEESLIPQLEAHHHRNAGTFRILARRKSQLLIFMFLMFFAVVLSITLITKSDLADFHFDPVFSIIRSDFNSDISDSLDPDPSNGDNSGTPLVTNSPTTEIEESADSEALSASSMTESTETVSTATEGQHQISEERSLHEFNDSSTSTTIPTSPSSPSNETVMACNLPKLNPFDPSIMHLIEEPEPINCGPKEFPLLLLSKTTLNSTLLLSQKRNPEDPPDENVKACYYHTLTRGNDPDDPDNSYVLSAERSNLPLETSAVSVLSPEHEFLVIMCDLLNKPETSEESEGSTTDTTKSDHSKVMDMHLLIPKKVEVEARIQNYYDKLSSHKMNQISYEGPLEEKDRVNVVVFGIDAVSRLNFIRTMPLTASFLMQNLSAVEMQGFNKIGDNTYPNLAAVLTPHNKSTLESTCEDDYYFDECPFIWKKYAENGYRTSFAEDSPWMAAFNYMKRGFKTPPTDYYLRPFLVAAEELIGSHMTMNANLCYGPRLTFEVMLDYIKQMAGSMGHDKRYFQFVWATGLTHDWLNYGRLGDVHLLSTLKWFQEGGYLNETIFILMSDHGIRWGDIHEYLQGQLEERLPFLFFVAPSWFQQKYSRAYQNLKLNQERLTTHFDLYETLLDLLDLRRLNEDSISYKEEALERADKLNKLPRGISQFLPIPLSRTCDMAEIEGHYCSCHRLQEVETTHPEVEQAANFVVYQINLMVSSHPQCGYLTLVSVRTAHVIDFGFNVSELEGGKGYELAVKTSPGNAVFAASVVKNETGVWKVSGPIGRTNLYGNQSHCVNEKELKLYCYCVDLLS